MRRTRPNGPSCLRPAPGRAQAFEHYLSSVKVVHSPRSIVR